MLKAKKIRLQVSEQDAATLEMMQGKCRGLYNWWVMRLRDGERWRCMEAKKTLAESRKFDPDIDQVYGKLLAEVYFRLDKAMQAFFKRVKNGRRQAFPACGPVTSSSPSATQRCMSRWKATRCCCPPGAGGARRTSPIPRLWLA